MQAQTHRAHGHQARHAAPSRMAARPPATTRCASKSRCARLNPALEVLAPVRDNACMRPEQLGYLKEHGLPVPPQGSGYSINRGLWGVTIGGRETLTSRESIPDEAWVLSRDAFTQPAGIRGTRWDSTRVYPSALDGEARWTRWS